MEEKERYKIDKSTNYYTNTIVDTKTNTYYGNIEEHIDLLNQQNEEILELKQQLEEIKNAKAQELADYLHTSIPKYIVNEKVELLKKVKENAWQSATDISCLLDYTELAKIIDSQINELKEMK